ncbi:MAG: hypothetical protein AAB403_20750, partial [Planctomycetota bacterium]
MRELADGPDPRKKLPTPREPQRTVNVRPSKAKKKGEQGDSVLTSVFRDGTRWVLPSHPAGVGVECVLEARNEVFTAETQRHREQHGVNRQQHQV